jgi:hypothetical protein
VGPGILEGIAWDRLAVITAPEQLIGSPFGYVGGIDRLNGLGDETHRAVNQKKISPTRMLACEAVFRQG